MSVITHPDLQVMTTLAYLYDNLRTDEILLQEFPDADHIVNGHFARVFVEDDNIFLPARQKFPALALWRAGPGERGDYAINLPATHAEFLCAWIDRVDKGGESLSAITGMTADGITKASMEANLVWHRICYHLENIDDNETICDYIEDIKPGRCEYLDLSEKKGVGYFGFLGTINVIHTHPPYIPLGETYDASLASGTLNQYSYDIDDETYSDTNFDVYYLEDLS